MQPFDQRNSDILFAISELEAAQARPLREVEVARLQKKAIPESASARVIEIEQQIAALRATFR